MKEELSQNLSVLTNIFNRLEDHWNISISTKENVISFGSCSTDEKRFNENILKPLKDYFKNCKKFGCDGIGYNNYLFKGDKQIVLLVPLTVGGNLGPGHIGWNLMTFENKNSLMEFIEMHKPPYTGPGLYTAENLKFVDSLDFEKLERKEDKELSIMHRIFNIRDKGCNTSLSEVKPKMK